MRGRASRDRLLLPRRSRIQTNTRVVHSVAARTDAPTCIPERWRRPTTYRPSPRQTSARKARYSWKGGHCPVRRFRLGLDHRGREVRPAREWKNRWPAQRPNVAAMMEEHDNALCSSIFNLGRRLVYCLFFFPELFIHRPISLQSPLAAAQLKSRQCCETASVPTASSPFFPTSCLCARMRVLGAGDEGLDARMPVPSSFTNEIRKGTEPGHSRNSIMPSFAL